MFNAKIPVQCPAPEDRLSAWYSGKTCDFSNFGCCFDEIINGDKISCCYAYGSDGPLKCCGYLS